MPPPRTRYEMEHNLYLVIEDFTARINSGDDDAIKNAMWATYRHLKDVKKTPNGRINMITYNEMIRNQANMLEWMKNINDK
ncbi:hypothetical protein [Flavobacterium covae]|uniref:hypothetical protein n=1 Tax=Flavobacterium TaxID=237 RepID=UPI000AA035E6|nr:hypothetical protein [Flavobacterium covae]